MIAAGQVWSYAGGNLIVMPLYRRHMRQWPWRETWDCVVLFYFDSPAHIGRIDWYPLEEYNDRGEYVWRRLA